MLSVIIEQKKNILIEAKFITISINTIGVSKSVIHLFPKNIFHELQDFVGNKVTLKILLKNKLDKVIILNKATVLINSIGNNSDSVEIQGNISFSDDYYPYNQELLNHINKYWNKNIIERSQFELNDYDLYLDTLLLWNGIPESLVVKSHYILDGSVVKNKYDLFIQIGEMFIGNKGYFGLNLDALDDCLSITMKGIMSKIPLEIKDSDLLSEKIGKDYFDSLVDVFNKYFDVKQW